MRAPIFQASKWEPPPEMRRIAHERVADIVGAWSQQIRWSPVDFVVLAESCYMQGVNDSVDALLRSNLKIVPRNDAAKEGAD
jgi:hypothetical protein